jgi:membrane-associated phospholipid phosphatase
MPHDRYLKEISPRRAGPRVTERMKSGWPALAVAAFVQSMAAFGLLAQAYTSRSPTVEIDSWLANALVANLVPSLTTAFVAVTALGSTPVLALVAGTASGYFVGRGHKRHAALLAVALIGAQLLTSVLKGIFERPRPSFDDPVATAEGFSFPSGHALSSIALYGALAYAFADGLQSTRGRVVGLGGVALLIGAIGFSRLYLGLHYLTDVLAGYSVGLAWLLLAIGLLHSRSPRPATIRDTIARRRGAAAHSSVAKTGTSMVAHQIGKAAP